MSFTNEETGSDDVLDSLKLLVDRSYAFDERAQKAEARYREGELGECLAEINRIATLGEHVMRLSNAMLPILRRRISEDSG